MRPSSLCSSDSEELEEIERDLPAYMSGPATAAGPSGSARMGDLLAPSSSAPSGSRTIAPKPASGGTASSSSTTKRAAPLNPYFPSSFGSSGPLQPSWPHDRRTTGAPRSIRPQAARTSLPGGANGAREAGSADKGKGRAVPRHSLPSFTRKVSTDARGVESSGESSQTRTESSQAFLTLASKVRSTSPADRDRTVPIPASLVRMGSTPVPGQGGTFREQQSSATPTSVRPTVTSASTRPLATPAIPAVSSLPLTRATTSTSTNSGPSPKPSIGSPAVPAADNSYQRNPSPLALSVRSSDQNATSTPATSSRTSSWTPGTSGISAIRTASPPVSQSKAESAFSKTNLTNIGDLRAARKSASTAVGSSSSSYIPNPFRMVPSFGKAGPASTASSTRTNAPWSSEGRTNSTTPAASAPPAPAPSSSRTLDPPAVLIPRLQKRHSGPPSSSDDFRPRKRIRIAPRPSAPSTDTVDLTLSDDDDDDDRPATRPPSSLSSSGTSSDGFEVIENRSIIKIATSSLRSDRPSSTQKAPTPFPLNPPSYLQRPSLASTTPLSDSSHAANLSVKTPTETPTPRKSPSSSRNPINAAAHTPSKPRAHTPIKGMAHSPCKAIAQAEPPRSLPASPRPVPSVAPPSTPLSLWDRNAQLVDRVTPESRFDIEADAVMQLQQQSDESLSVETPGSATTSIKHLPLLKRNLRQGLRGIAAGLFSTSSPSPARTPHGANPVIAKSRRSLKAGPTKLDDLLSGREEEEGSLSTARISRVMQLRLSNVTLEDQAGRVVQLGRGQLPGPGQIQIIVDHKLVIFASPLIGIKRSPQDPAQLELSPKLDFFDLALRPFGTSEPPHTIQVRFIDIPAADGTPWTIRDQPAAKWESPPLLITSIDGTYCNPGEVVLRNSDSSMSIKLGMPLEWKLSHHRPMKNLKKCIVPPPAASRVRLRYVVESELGEAKVVQKEGWHCAFCGEDGRVPGEPELYLHFAVVHRQDGWVEMIKRETSADGMTTLDLHVHVKEKRPSSQQSASPPPKSPKSLKDVPQQDDERPAEIQQLPTPNSEVFELGAGTEVEEKLREKGKQRAGAGSELEPDYDAWPPPDPTGMGLARPQMYKRKNQWTKWSRRVAPNTLADLLSELDDYFDGGDDRHNLIYQEESTVWTWHHLSDKWRFTMSVWNRWREEAGPFIPTGRKVDVQRFMDKYAAILRRADCEAEVKNHIYILANQFSITMELYVELCEYWDDLAEMARGRVSTG